MSLKLMIWVPFVSIFLQNPKDLKKKKEISITYAWNKISNIRNYFFLIILETPSSANSEGVCVFTFIKLWVLIKQCTIFLCQKPLIVTCSIGWQKLAAFRRRQKWPSQSIWKTSATLCSIILTVLDFYHTNNTNLWLLSEVELMNSVYRRCLQSASSPTLFLSGKFLW